MQAAGLLASSGRPLLCSETTESSACLEKPQDMDTANSYLAVRSEVTGPGPAGAPAVGTKLGTKLGTCSGDDTTVGHLHDARPVYIWHDVLVCFLERLVEHSLQASSQSKIDS